MQFRFMIDSTSWTNHRWKSWHILLEGLNSQYQTPFWCIRSYLTAYLLPVCLMGHQVDKLAFKEEMASIVLKLGRFEEAEKMYRFLLVMNPDNYR